jgi:hypothetical protein
MRVFLDIDIGDAAAFAEASAAFARTMEFLTAVGVPQLGLPPDLVRTTAGDPAPRLAALRRPRRACCCQAAPASPWGGLYRTRPEPRATRFCRPPSCSSPPLALAGPAHRPRQDALDADGRALLLESYEADKAWSAKGPALTERPPPLRAGRIVAELFTSDTPKTAENFRCFDVLGVGAGVAGGRVKGNGVEGGGLEGQGAEGDGPKGAGLRGAGSRGESKVTGWPLLVDAFSDCLASLLLLLAAPRLLESLRGH